MSDFMTSRPVIFALSMTWTASKMLTYAEIAGKCDIGADFLRRSIAVYGEIGPSSRRIASRPGATEIRGSSSFAFLQAVVGEIKIFAGDI